MNGYILTKITAALVSVVLTTTIQPLVYPTMLAHADCQTFLETGKIVCGKFLTHWRSQGGVTQFGYPISEEFQEQSLTDFKTYTTQYFERAVFELHPENQPPHDVLLSLLGVEENQRYYGVGYYELGGPSYQKANTENPLFFNETGRTIGGRFRQYWERNGGLIQHGYPITDEFQEWNRLDGRRYTVQYFQRAVFELHPENTPPYDVLLSQLGTFQFRYRHPNKLPRVEDDIMYVPEYPGAQNRQVLVQIDPRQTNVKEGVPYKVVTFVTPNAPEEVFIFLRGNLLSRYWEDWRSYLVEQEPSSILIIGFGHGLSAPLYEFIAKTEQKDGLTYLRVERYLYGGM